MRILKNKKGEFYIDDTPMTFTSKKAWDAFVAELDNPVSSNPNHARVLAECQRKAKEMNSDYAF